MIPAAASAAATPSARLPAKGERTRARIIEAGLDIASHDGLEGITIGHLAERLAMSKSGLIAHFGTRENLQLAVLDRYAGRFVAEVLVPALGCARGLPRLGAVLENWLAFLSREIDRGCLMIAGAIEYDARPGPLRDAVIGIIEAWKAELRLGLGHARELQQLRDGFDPEQFIFEVYGLMLMVHQEARLDGAATAQGRARAGLARLLDDARRPVSNTSPRPPRAAAIRKPAARP